MESTGPIILGLQFVPFLLIASGVFYLLCAFLLWKPMRQEKNELIYALFAFLCYQAINMFFMGLEIQTMNMVYSNIAALSVLVGSAYMLKFPFSSLSQGTRKAIFGLSIVAVLSVFVWFMQTEARQEALMNFTLWYDLAVNGILVGGFMILLALRTAGSQRIKAMGGGSGVVSCCVLSNGAMLGGAMLTSATFGFLAPVLILGSLLVARRR